MFRIYGMLIGVLAASVFVIPVFCIYGKYVFRDARRTFAYTLFGLYLAAVLVLVGFPGVTSLTLDLSINAVPFVGMAADAVNACLNVLLFVPLGVFLPLLWTGYARLKHTVLAALCMSAVIELSQIFTLRATDINDLITNTAGAVLGYLAARALTGNFSKHVRSNARSGDLYLICGTVAAVMFLLQPPVASFLWGLIL